MQGQLAITGAKWCDFFVWLGKCSYLERIFADEELWHSTMLPGLVAFYDTHARPYLLRKNRPVAPMKAEEKAGNQPGVCSQAASESLLPAEQCQSTIDGRSGSSACAIIAGLFSHYFLFADERPCLTPSALCKVMADGNAVYDSHEFSGRFLSADEVLNLRPSLGLRMLHEKFLRPNQLSTLVDLLRGDCSQSPRRKAAALFVCTPYSFSLACTDDEFFFV